MENFVGFEPLEITLKMLHSSALSSLSSGLSLILKELIMPGLLRFFLILLLVVFHGCGSPKKAFQRTVLPELPPAPKPEINTSFAIDVDEERVALTKAYFEAHNQKLFQSFPQSNDVSSIRFDPKIVVVHFTVINSLKKTVDYFAPNTIASNRGVVAKSGALNVGVQFIVDRDGSIYQQYPDNVMARHVIGLNHVAIGIENIGNADLGTPAIGDKSPLTEAQLAANTALIRYLAGKYPDLDYVIGHYEYRDLEHPSHPAHELFVEDQPSYRTEKVDPGQRFMRTLRTRLKKN